MFRSPARPTRTGWPRSVTAERKWVSVSPDYADNTKFADEWMPCAAGTDGALAMAMGHVILSECFVHNRVPFFVDYVRQYTDLPFLVKLEERDGVLVPGKNLTAADLGQDVENSAFKPVLLDGATDTVAVPKGSLGFRYGDDGVGKWNLDLGDLVPALTVAGPGGQTALVHLPRFDTVDGHGETLSPGGAGTAGRRAPGVHGVRPDARPVRGGPARAAAATWPTGYDDAAEPYTPAWQEPITGVSAAQAIRVAKEFARNAVESGGRSMIIMGAGICQWFHGDATYRAVLALLLLTGSMGRNGGGWAHYVGQEKCRPVTGWAAMAMGTDWCRPPRQMAGTTVLVHPHRSVALRRVPGRRAGQPAGPRPVSREAHDGCAYLGGGDGLDAVLSAVRPVQPGGRRRGPRRRQRDPRLRRRAAGRGRAEAGCHRSGQPEELAAGAGHLAGQPARLVEQGQRVLPAPPAGHHVESAGAARPGGVAAQRCRVVR